jgi:hypothetical protein
MLRGVLTLLSGLAAVLVSVLLSTVVTLWIRSLDRREADWLTYNATSLWVPKSEYGNVSPPHADSTLANVGDAAAYRVRVEGERCSPSLGMPYRPDSGRRTFEVVAAMPPGAEVNLWVRCHPDDWQEAVVIIRWTSSPTRKKSSKRTYRLPVADIAVSPTPR